MTLREVEKYARSQGYDGCEHAGEWNGFDVYEPTIADIPPGEFVCTGPPLVILVSGDDARMSTPDEAFAVLDSLDPTEEDE